MKRQRFLKPGVKLIRFPFKLAIILLIAASAIAFGLSSLAGFLSRSDYFTVKDIISNEPMRGELSYLKGRNIFALDLRRQQDILRDDFPDYRQVRLIRVLPNRLYAEFVKRRPVALVRLYKYMFVDSEGVLFDMPKDERITDLPVILGLETRIFGPKSGRRYSSRELLASLDIIREAARFRWFRSYRVEKVDVASLNSISLFLLVPARNRAVKTPDLAGELLEVKMDASDIRAKLRILVELLREVKDDSAKIRYIDLRFKEPVIKFRDVR